MLLKTVRLRCGVMRQTYSLSRLIATASIIFLCFDDFGNKNGTKIDMNIGLMALELANATACIHSSTIVENCIQLKWDIRNHLLHDINCFAFAISLARSLVVSLLRWLEWKSFAFVATKTCFDKMKNSFFRDFIQFFVLLIFWSKCQQGTSVRDAAAS